MIWGQEYLLKKPQPFQSKKVQLYDIIDDPNEVNDVSIENPEVTSSDHIKEESSVINMFSLLNCWRKRFSQPRKSLIYRLIGPQVIKRQT